MSERSGQRLRFGYGGDAGNPKRYTLYRVERRSLSVEILARGLALDAVQERLCALMEAHPLAGLASFQPVGSPPYSPPLVPRTKADVRRCFRRRHPSERIAFWSVAPAKLAEVGETLTQLERLGALAGVPEKTRGVVASARLLIRGLEGVVAPREIAKAEAQLAKRRAKGKR